MYCPICHYNNNCFEDCFHQMIAHCEKEYPHLVEETVSEMPQHPEIAKSNS